jgi:hypothetical protein
MHVTGGSWPHRARRSALAALTSSALLAAFVARAVPAAAATINVNCSSQSLQAKIEAAAPGSTLLIKGVCVGTFLVDKTLTLKGNPSATLDGNDTDTTLTAPNTHTVHLIGLTITGGSSVTGAGILRTGGGTRLLSLDHVIVTDNLATGPIAQGGGIFSDGGPVTLTSSTVIENRASAITSAGDVTAAAAGIASFGSLTLIRSTVSSNRAVAKSSGPADAVGAGILGGSGGASLVIKMSHVDGNRARAISAAEATTVGGGVDWHSAGDLTIQSSTISGNLSTATATTGDHRATASDGGMFARFDVGVVSGTTIANNQATATSAGGDGDAFGGGAETQAAARLTLTGVRITGSRVTGTGALQGFADAGALSNIGRLILRSSTLAGSSVHTRGGIASGTASWGGLYQQGPLVMTNTTVDRNHVTATADDSGAFAYYGGMYVGGYPSIISGSTISRNTLEASAPGDNSARTVGAGIRVVGGSPETVKITNSTIAGNVARAESSAAAGTAEATGGGIDSSADSLLLTNTTVARNLVGGAGATTTLRGGGLAVEGGTTTLKATILGLNTAPATGGPNCFGKVASAGNNVLGTTNGCTFSSKPSDKLNRDPKLGLLKNNGGPTSTLALLNGSPALNVIAPAMCAVSVDQRGIHRPQPVGGKCDVGSFERKI